MNADQPTLFELEESLSPKDLWLQKHGLIMWKDGMNEWHVESKKNILEWWAKHEPSIELPSWTLKGMYLDMLSQGHICDYAELSTDLEESIVEWAKSNKVPLWNEEEFAAQRKTPAG